MRTSDRVLHPELSYRITGMCFQVQKDLGRFCKEKQYADRLEALLTEGELVYKREVEIQSFNADSPKGNIIDFIIADTIIVDCKAKKFVTKEDYMQMQRYLHGAGLELGMIVNFRDTFLKPKRILNSDYNHG